MLMCGTNTVSHTHEREKLSHAGLITFSAAAVYRIRHVNICLGSAMMIRR